MRVCLVSRELSPFWGAGIGTYVAQMATAWAGAGHEVHVLTLPHQGLAERGAELLPGVRIRTLDLERGEAARVGYRFGFLRHAMAVYESLLRLHAEAPFDYIEFPEYWAEGYFAIRARGTLGRLAGAVLGVRLHTPTHECRLLNGQSWLDEEIASLEHAEEASVREADVVISPSASLLEQVSQRLGLAADRPRRAVVPYPFTLGADLDGGATGGRAAEVPAPTVLYFGRLERRKGVHLLVEAGQELLRRGNSATFRFIGADTQTGPMGSSMLAHLKSLVEPGFRERFVFDGPRPRTELGAIVRGTGAGGVCCFPSLWENFPNACVEAMALGAAVVGSDAGGMAEIIQDGRSGLLFRSGDSGSLISVLARALGDAGLRERLAREAPGRIVGLCRPETVVGQMVSAIAGVGPVVPAVPAEGGFAILVPTIGDHAAVRETLVSAAAQTLPPQETIAMSASGHPAAWGPGVRVALYDPSGSALAAGLRAATARWAVWVRPGVRLDPEFLERAAAALGRNPGVTFLSALASPRPGLIDRVPLGLDRDLLPATDCAWSGALVLERAGALAATGTVEWVGPGEEWAVCCALAEGGARSTAIPEVLLHGDGAVRMPETDLDRFTGHIAHMHPALPLRPDRTLRLLAAQRARLRERAVAAVEKTVAVEAQLPALREQLSREQEARQQAEARAASLRYRAADAAHRVVSGLGLRRPLRAVAGLLFGGRGAGEGGRR